MIVASVGVYQIRQGRKRLLEEKENKPVQWQVANPIAKPNRSTQHKMVLLRKICNQPIADGSRTLGLVPGVCDWRKKPMNTLSHIIYRLKIWSDSIGQDLIEYALMAGFVAVACGAAFPPVANTISQIFSKINSVLSSSNAS